MDPSATLALLILKAMEPERVSESFEELSRDLRAWDAKGGWVPSFTGAWGKAYWCANPSGRNWRADVIDPEIVRKIRRYLPKGWI